VPRVADPKRDVLGELDVVAAIAALPHAVTPGIRFHEAHRHSYFARTSSGVRAGSCSQVVQLGVALPAPTYASGSSESKLASERPPLESNSVAVGGRESHATGR
jgi:hypothetical protein